MMDDGRNLRISIGWQKLIVAYVGLAFVGLAFAGAVGTHVARAQETTNPTTNVPDVPANPKHESLWTRDQGQDWPTFLGPTGDGKSTERGILKDWTEGKLKILWTTPTGQGYGMGSVSEGRFYHFGRFDGQAEVRCLNAETGNQIWKFSYPSDYRDLYGYDSGPRASPLINDGRVYLFGVEGMLHCLNAYDGKLIWKVDTAQRFGVIQNFFGVASTPVVFNDLLIVMVGGSPAESQTVPPGMLNRIKPNASGLVAFDKKTGELKYQIVDDLASYASLKLVDRPEGPLLLAWMRESLFGIDPANGNQVFEFPWRSRKLESVNASMPVAVSDYVLVSECYEIGSVLLQLDGMAGSPPTVVWSDRGKRNPSLAAHWNTPIVIGDAMYGCSGRHPGTAELRCLDWKTGQVRWTSNDFSRTSLTYIDDHLIVLDEQGQLRLIQANSDRLAPVTVYEPGERGVKFMPPCWAAPIVSHGLLYVRDKNQLVCFELIEEE